MKSSDNILVLNHWYIKSSESIKMSGSPASPPVDEGTDSIPAKVPSTILGAMVENNIYDNPYFGENLKSIPTEQFKVPWWYSTIFSVDAGKSMPFAMLYFEGINYKANIWLNKHHIGDSLEIDGAYKRTQIDVSNSIVQDFNQLAVEVIPPGPGDFSTGFVDWNPAPPDGNMGIFRPVILKFHRGVRIEEPFVRSKISFGDTVTARLTISTELCNDRNDVALGILKGRIGNIAFEQSVTLPGKRKTEIVLKPDQFDCLTIINPRLWWPLHHGVPALYDLELEFILEGEVSDASHTRFGIREVTDYWLDNTHRGYKINGRKILIKGAGWTDDLFLMDSHDGIEAQVRYVKHMGLNCIRLEGIWGKDHKLYDLCDENGILLMVGWSCHWEHEIHMGVPVDERFGAVHQPKDIEHVAQAWEDQVIWLRNHPSIFVWTVASDKVPITELERRYIEIFARYDPDRPYLNSTGGVGSDQHVIGSEDVISEISGSSGVKMLGPYDYTAPVYWYSDTRYGGAYGFNTETGPGVQVPQLDSLKRFIPYDKLWPINEVWDYHCGRNEFSSMDRFTTALNERYGSPASILEFDRKAQAMNYELMRPMFEAFRVHKSKTTGIIQWMLNGAWPKMYWQLYDYFLNPTAAFYSTKKACAPLQLIYNYADHRVYGVNDQPIRVDDLVAIIRVYDIHSQIIIEETIGFDSYPDSSIPLFRIEAPESISMVYFIDQRLYDGNENELNTNFYWLSTREEILDYDADLGGFAFHTPSKQYSDFTLLNSIPIATIAVDCDVKTGDTQNEVIVNLENRSGTIAFLINLKLIDESTGDLILPVFWDDNFISLAPHEKRCVRAGFEPGVQATVKVEGWNINLKK